MIKLVVALILALMTTGCVYQQQGSRFSTDVVKSFTPGVTTEDEAIAKLGKPMATSNMADGSQLLQWQYVYGTALGVGGGAHAAILFGADGKMIRVTHLFEQ